jgi:hypothetical protein
MKTHINQTVMIAAFTMTSFISSVTAQNKHSINEGKYIIKCAKNTTMVLDGTNVGKGENVKLKKRDTSRKGQIWKVSRVDGPLGGYEIKCIDNNLVLDGDAIELTASLLPNSNANDIIKLQLWDRNSSGLRTNQEWYVSKSDRFKIIYNVMNDTKLIDAKDDLTEGSRVKLYKRRTSRHDKTQQWIFERAN